MKRRRRVLTKKQISLLQLRRKKIALLKRRRLLAGGGKSKPTSSAADSAVGKKRVHRILRRRVLKRTATQLKDGKVVVVPSSTLQLRTKKKSEGKLTKVRKTSPLKVLRTRRRGPSSSLLQKVNDNDDGDLASDPSAASSGAKTKQRPKLRKVVPREDKVHFIHKMKIPGASAKGNTLFVESLD